MPTISDRYVAYLDICQTGDWQNSGECTNSEIGFARRALQLHLVLILFSSEIISCRTVLQGLNLQILENRYVFLPATEKVENKELLKCCNREIFIVYLPEIRGGLMHYWRIDSSEMGTGQLACWKGEDESPNWWWFQQRTPWKSKFSPEFKNTLVSVMGNFLCDS